MSPELLMQILIPILIFLARVADVSLGTLRIIFVSRGVRYLAAIFAFFEIVIWLIAISQIMQNLGNIMNYIAYAAGFSMGSFVGISIEKQFFTGSLMVRVVIKRDAGELIDILRFQGYGVTCADGQGSKGPVKIIFTVVDRKNLNAVINIIKENNPYAFYTVEDMRFASEYNVFPLPTPRSFFRRFNSSFQKRK